MRNLGNAMAEDVSGRIVAAIGVTHTPGLGDQMDRPDPTQVRRLLEGFGVVRQQIEQARPDVIVAFVNDHFDMFTLNGMPGFAIGLGDTHWGPTPETEAWIQMKRGPVRGHSALALDIHASLMNDGFELYRFESAEFVHNVLLPKKFLWPELDIPVVPIFVNCFVPPLPTWRRAYELGQALRKVVARRSERVALLASGGISHWPPIVLDEFQPGDPLRERLLQVHMHGRAAMKTDPTFPLALLEREREMAASDRELINISWDRDFLERLAKGDVDYLTNLRHEDVRAVAGSGGAEMLLWVALMGAMNAAKARVVMYEPVKEWMGGVGLLIYAVNQG
ncbi:MAG TPA: hypothetical protein VJQ82_07755 [Terriglobales bacterium]|nr:hypothetical protein [Terriglobales bacterium]